MNKEVQKIVIFKDGKAHFIPTKLIGYNGIIEINGKVVSYDTNAKYVASEEVKTLRFGMRTEVPVEYIYGTHKILVEQYDARLEYLKKNFKEKIDETFDDEGEPRRVCIWTDKNAEIEYYNLTTKYKPVMKPIFSFGDYVEFEVVTLPKSTSKYIVPDWKVSEDFSLTCLFKRRDFLNDITNEISKQYSTLKVKNYMGNYDPSMYINNQCYRPSQTGNFTRASYKDCVAAEKALRKEIEQMFKIEFGKTKENPLCNATTTLNEVSEILRKFQRIQTKIATRNEYNSCFNMITSLKKKLETEVSS